MHPRAVSLLLATYGRTGDSSYLKAARTVLDFMVDSGDGVTADVARDDPPSLVRAGLVRNLAVGWALTGTSRYRDAARVVLQRLARELGDGPESAVFADREAYVIGSVLEAAPAVGDSAVAPRALGALDRLHPITVQRQHRAPPPHRRD